jgi:hypothetical protein
LPFVVSGDNHQTAQLWIGWRIASHGATPS